MTKTVFIETYGCQMNEYDSELVRSILKKENYEIVTDELGADIVMLNTCTVRDNADRKVVNRVHEIKNRRKPDPVLVGILGCMATNFKTKLLEDPNLGIDFIAGPDSYKQLPKLISEVTQSGDKSFDITLSEFETYSDISPSRDEGVNAWIAIMRGCNNFCTFCVVPYTRGRERSRDPESVVDEVKRLVSAGFHQVTLLGQNVNSYRHDATDFADLMAMVSDVPGVERIRFTSPHPKDFPSKLLRLMADRPNICKQIHLPLQAGNTRVLDKMNRTYTKDEFLALVDEIRATIPGISFSTDIIVGFPTETAEEFEDTVDVVRRVRFDSAYIFKYSERPNTLAARRLKDDVSEEEKTRRIVVLNELQRAISLEKNRDYIGRVERILIEKDSTKKSDMDCQGRTDSNRIVIIPKSDYRIGDWVTVTITDATPNVLKGMPI
ncbi:tRNA (N6-isopentenyl adenosine(37)-C2)-methylthiotransferase MiaB [bacterium]|nr:tRNA (N6-isopentenyl adenosine(37)-C2)-methylthiotransferase MiaB [bacterium]